MTTENIQVFPQCIATGHSTSQDQITLLFLCIENLSFLSSKRLLTQESLNKMIAHFCKICAVSIHVVFYLMAKKNGLSHKLLPKKAKCYASPPPPPALRPIFFIFFLATKGGKKCQKLSSARSAMWQK